MDKMDNLYIDLHVLQTVPASCVNRDDTGSPKTVIYGGTMRSRVSSQAWKRAMRKMFMDSLNSEMVGIRTRTPSQIVKKELLNINPDMDEDSADELVSEALSIAGIKGEGKDVLFFISLPQAKALAQEITAENKKKQSGKEISKDNIDENEKKKADKNGPDKEYKAALINAVKENPSVDMILFGRMAASNPTLNYDAACQVAHSISTHTINNEYDYFTAVDDLSTDDDSGAGHIGTVEFNSSTLYRYATLNVNELKERLSGDLVPKVVNVFIDAFIRSMPTGKQNTFANRTLPDLVYVTIRKDQPINLAGAFEKPVYAGIDGNVAISIKRIANYASNVYKNYADAPEKAWTIGSELEGLGEQTNIKELLNKVSDYIISGK